ncbi:MULTISPECIES: restriction endonuclease subunit S [unclassified Acinetobacter]|uniref:restriction endonuclease subunit S n=1 Tax=unclassified Acinetobacter TaxID=196816 RepID=UPI00358E021E
MSWEQVKLGDIFEIARGGSPRPIDQYITDDPNGLNWISIKDASNSSKYIYKTEKKIKPEGLHKTRLVHPNDFLLTNSMSFGRPYIMKTTGCIHDGWLVLSADKTKVDTDYFYHLLGSDFMYRKFTGLAAGAVVKNLNTELVKSVSVPLPPLAEQRQIASILDQADELRQKRQQAIEKLDQLLQATFIDMFGDPVSNPKGWEVLKWGDALKIINGKNQKAVLDQNGTFPICGSGGVMGYANEWLTPAQSVIIGRKGNINKPILMFENFWNVDTAFGLVPNKDLLKVDYLFWFCHFFNFEQLNKTVTIPSLTKSDLLNIKIPIPPLEKQLYFSNICDQTRKLKSKMELKDLNLFSSLQNQAFSGTL